MDNNSEVEIKKESSSNVLLPGTQCPQFCNMQAVMEDGVTVKSFSSFEKRYVVLLFLPMDSSVDHSELMAFKGNMENFEEKDCQVVGVTSASLTTIKNLVKLEPNQGGTGGPVNFPIISDSTMEVATMFGISRTSGMPDRVTFILDKKRMVRHSSVYPRMVGRSVEEVLRTLNDIKENDQTIGVNTRKLRRACRLGKTEEVEVVLGGGDVDVNGTDYDGSDYLPGSRPPLTIAVYNEHLDIVRILLEQPGIQLGKRCNAGYTALHYACFAGSVTIVQLLCEHSRCSPAIRNKKDRHGDTPLMTAVYCDELEIVKKLDIKGTDFFTTRHGRSLMEVAAAEDNADVLEYLMEREKVDSLQVIAAVNIAKCVENKADVKALEIPETLERFLEGFIDDSE